MRRTGRFSELCEEAVERRRNLKIDAGGIYGEVMRTVGFLKSLEGNEEEERHHQEVERRDAEMDGERKEKERGAPQGREKEDDVGQEEGSSHLFDGVRESKEEHVEEEEKRKERKENRKERKKQRERSKERHGEEPSQSSTEESISFGNPYSVIASCVSDVGGEPEFACADLNVDLETNYQRKSVVDQHMTFEALNQDETIGEKKPRKRRPFDSPTPPSDLSSVDENASEDVVIHHP